MKKLFFILLVFCCSAAIAQTPENTSATQGAKLYEHNDTFYVRKVLVVTQELDRKTGKVRREWWKKVNVKSGYIVRLTDGMFLINKKVMEPDYFSYTEFVKK